jgi:cell division protein ZapA
MKGSVSPDYMAKLAEYVDDRMRLIGSANARLGMNKVAVLAAINLADELFKARRQLQDLETLMDKKSLL